MGLLRNKLGFQGWFPRGQRSVRVGAPVTSFAPIERRIRTTLPEKRGNSLSGNFTDNILSLLPAPSSSGAAVNETTALGVSAVTACVGLMADMVAKLPIYLYRDSPSGPIEVTDHPAARLVNGMPSARHTCFELKQLMETGRGLGGNGYARVYRDAHLQPRAIEWLPPCDVSPYLGTNLLGESAIRYRISGSPTLERSEVIHVRSGFTRDGVIGISPVSMLRESIGTALAQTAKAGSMMKNGTNFPGFLLAPQTISPDKLKDAREEWDQNQSGINSGRIPMIHGGWDFKQTNGMTMVDVQFLESRRFELQEIARYYRIPSFMIGDSSASTTWGTGIDAQMLGFLNTCLDADLVAWEQSLAFTLLTVEEVRAGMYFQFDRDQLISAALAARANFYQTMRNIGVYSPNDVRAKLNEPLISADDGGDDYGRPFNASGGSPEPTKGPAEPVPTPEKTP